MSSTKRKQNVLTLALPPLPGRELPQWVRDLLGCPPAPGEGGLDGWIFRTARGLCPYREDAEIITLLTACAPTEAAKIARVVPNARCCAWHPNTATTTTLPQPKKKWPDPDLARIAQIVEEGPTAARLWKHSPVRWDVDDGSNCEEIVRTLFADAATPDPLLCIAQSADTFATRRLSAWLACKRLADFSFIVPAHMVTRTGLTKAGKESEHTLDATGDHRFVVVEFDFVATSKNTGKPTLYAPLIARWQDLGKSVVDACAALLWHLDEYTPLVLGVHSGGKSLQGWFPVGNNPLSAIDRFSRHAARLGADTTLFSNRSQFVRLPAGTRQGGCRQSVFFFAPDTLGKFSFNTW